MKGTCRDLGRKRAVLLAPDFGVQPATSFNFGNVFPDTVSVELQRDLRRMYVAQYELLRHFWTCFPTTSAQLEDKVARAVPWPETRNGRAEDFALREASKRGRRRYCESSGDVPGINGDANERTRIGSISTTTLQLKHALSDEQLSRDILPRYISSALGGSDVSGDVSSQLGRAPVKTVA